MDYRSFGAQLGGLPVNNSTANELTAVTFQLAAVNLATGKAICLSGNCEDRKTKRGIQSSLRPELFHDFFIG